MTVAVTEFEDVLQVQAECRVDLAKYYRDWIFARFKSDVEFFDKNPTYQVVGIRKDDAGLFEFVTSESIAVEGKDSFECFEDAKITDLLFLHKAGKGKISFYWDLEEEKGQMNYNSAGKAECEYFRRVMTGPQERKMREMADKAKEGILTVLELSATKDKKKAPKPTEMNS